MKAVVSWKRIVILVAIFLPLTVGVAVAGFESHPTVMVADFGINAGATSPELQTANAGKTASEGIIYALTKDGHFDVVDRVLVEKHIEAEGLDVEGLVDPDTARRLGQLLHAPYLIYGNVTDVSLSSTGVLANAEVSGGVGVRTVKAHVTLRMMDVATGDIVMAAKGEGKSKSSTTIIGKDIAYITIGTAKVTQDAVHNALQKAAQNAVDILVGRLYGETNKK
ncbi:MAG: hypothetical protein IJ849_07040 [Selenomonadaceae bacterium]|nr:hypothetical protein [Selenomonadaceae bacterium]